MECVKHAVGCFEWIVLRGGWGGIGGNLGRRGWFLDAHAAEIGGVCDGSDGWRRSTFAAECNELRGLGLLVLRRLGEECSWREEFCGKQVGRVAVDLHMRFVELTWLFIYMFVYL